MKKTIFVIFSIALIIFIASLFWAVKIGDFDKIVSVGIPDVTKGEIPIQPVVSPEDIFPDETLDDLEEMLSSSVVGIESIDPCSATKDDIEEAIELLKMSQQMGDEVASTKIDSWLKKALRSHAYGKLKGGAGDSEIYETARIMQTLGFTDMSEDLISASKNKTDFPSGCECRDIYDESVWRGSITLTDTLSGSSGSSHSIEKFVVKTGIIDLPVKNGCIDVTVPAIASVSYKATGRIPDLDCTFTHHYEFPDSPITLHLTIYFTMLVEEMKCNYLITMEYLNFPNITFYRDYCVQVYPVTFQYERDPFHAEGPIVEGPKMVGVSGSEPSICNLTREYVLELDLSRVKGK